MIKTTERRQRYLKRRLAFPASLKAFFIRYSNNTNKKIKKQAKMWGEDPPLYFLSSFLLFPLVKWVFLPAPFPKRQKIKTFTNIDENRNIR
jgi:hypothetical protein